MIKTATTLRNSTSTLALAAGLGAHTMLRGPQVSFSPDEPAAAGGETAQPEVAAKSDAVLAEALMGESSKAGPGAGTGKDGTYGSAGDVKSGDQPKEGDAPAPKPDEKAPAPAPKEGEKEGAEDEEKPTSILGRADPDAAKNVKADEKAPVKTEAELAAEAKAKEEAEKAKADAPAPEVKFDVAALKAPEGFDALDADALAKAAPILASLGVETTEKAQEAIDAFAKEVLPAMVDRGVGAERARINQLATETRAQWAGETEKEWAGPQMGQNMAHAAKFRDSFGDAELVETLNATGLGNHPAIVRAFIKAGKAMSEDTLTSGDTSAQVRKDTPAEEKLYDPVFHAKKG